MHSHEHRCRCHGICILLACSCHFGDVRVMCWRAWWPKQPAAFPQGWHVHYALTTRTASIRGPGSTWNSLWQPLRQPSASRSQLLIHPEKTISKKIATHTSEFPRYRLNRCHGSDVHETWRGPLETFNHLAFTTLRAPAKLCRRRIKCTIIWYYSIYYRALGCDQIGQLSERC